MVDFSYSSEVIINASPQAIFDIVSNPANHAALVRSEELKTITTGRPCGSRHAHHGRRDHHEMTDGSGMDLTADSIVVTFDTPNSFSWIVNAALPEQFRRIQWWFNMSADGDSTKVTHEVEVDWGNLTHEMLIGLRDKYEQVRAGVVRTGMDKTVENLKAMAEG